MSSMRKFPNRKAKGTFATDARGPLEKLVAFNGKRVPLWNVLVTRKRSAKTTEDYRANDDFWTRSLAICHSRVS